MGLSDMLVRVHWRAEVIVSTTYELITGAFQTHQHLAAQCAEHRWHSPAYWPTGYVCTTEHRNRQNILTKGVDELVHISWWILEDSGSGTFPASHQETSESPTPPALLGGGVFSWVLRVKSIRYRHGRSAVAMLSVIKCSYGGVLIRETRFSFSE